MDHIYTETQFPEALFITDLIILEDEFRGGLALRITRATDRAVHVSVMETGESKAFLALGRFPLHALENREYRADAIAHIRQACSQAGAMKKTAMLRPGE